MARAQSPASTVCLQGWEQGSQTRWRTAPPAPGPAPPPHCSHRRLDWVFRTPEWRQRTGTCSRLGRGEICGHDGLRGRGRKGCHRTGWGTELPRPRKPVQSEVRAWTSLDSAGRCLYLSQLEGLLKQVPVPHVNQQLWRLLKTCNSQNPQASCCYLEHTGISVGSLYSLIPHTAWLLERQVPAAYWVIPDSIKAEAYTQIPSTPSSPGAKTPL